MGSLITLGLAEIQVGAAGASGVMPGSMAKIGATYRDTCKLEQADSEVTEHFEEGKAAPMVRKKAKNLPVLTFSIMDPDVQMLIDYIGGDDIGGGGSPKWGFDGSEAVANKAIRVMSEQGLWVDIPNADIEAVIDADMSAKGLFMVNFTVTPMAVSDGKPIHAYDGTTGLAVTPTLLTFGASADNTGKTITASSSGNVTYAAAPSNAEWVTVTRANKVVTVKVAANANTEDRTTIVTIVADGLTAYVPVTQAGA